jgi:hypothetical protein
MFPALSLLALGIVIAAVSAPAQQPAGLETSWEIAPVIDGIATHAERLLTALERVDARAWINKGASETYLQQLQSSQEQAKALAAGAKALARNPEHVSAGLVVLFRVQSLETMLLSLEEGLRKYQSPAEAQALAALVAEDGANRDRLQAYLVNLAAEQEHQFKVMDQEAQRCRAISLPASPGKKK